MTATIAARSPAQGMSQPLHPPPPIDPCDPSIILNDPPPPYPNRDRRLLRPLRPLRRINVQRIHTSHHVQLPSSDSTCAPISPVSPGSQTEEDYWEPTETTFLLAPALARRGTSRPRSYSYASSASATPSFAQTIFSLFQTEDEPYLTDDADERSYLAMQNETDGHDPSEQRWSTSFFSLAAWRRYFRPMWRKAYYSSLFHLLVLNFPYALAAWVYLFVFTVTGTTLLMALPLGAVLCFFDLLGARTFARGELTLQSRFHYPLSYPTPSPPRPIFTRYRDPTVGEIETGQYSPRSLVRETSFYKNTYAMFTDPTSYQALFYFLVIKPAITLILTFVVIVLLLPAIILVLPAPAALRAVRKLGIWQANVAIEGLYLAHR